jgi:hypothetical protein
MLPQRVRANHIDRTVSRFRTTVSSPSAETKVSASASFSTIELGFAAHLGIGQAVQCLLVGRVSLLQVIRHQITVTWLTQYNEHNQLPTYRFPRASIMRRIADLPRDPQTSPFSGEIFSVLW